MHSPPHPDAWHVFQRCPAFAPLPSSTLQEVFESVLERTYGAGDLIMRQGEPADGLLVLLEGRAYAITDDEGGRHTVGAFTTGDVVGEMALVTRQPRTANVTADTPVRALFLPTEVFDRLAVRHLELCVVLTNLVAERLGAATRDGLGGKTLDDRYRILRTLGRGGMSVVYRARDERSLQDVALKMMSHRLTYEPGALARFQREAEIVQSLQHENIARFERLFPAYGTYFLVMELCDGVDLSGLVGQRGPLPEAQVKRVIGQLALALTHVHRMGLVHRDLKPSNVLISQSGVVKLTDFGVAVSNTQITDDTRTAARSLFVGTPAFMAPEQLTSQPLDARADIYALACVAFNTLTGRYVCDATNLLDLVQQKVSFRLPPPTEIGGGVAADMYEFLERALQVDREARLNSLESLTAWAGPLEPLTNT